MTAPIDDAVSFQLNRIADALEYANELKAAELDEARRFAEQAERNNATQSEFIARASDQIATEQAIYETVMARIEKQVTEVIAGQLAGNPKRRTR